MLDHVICSREQFSFRCALKMVAELFVTRDREFQTAGNRDAECLRLEVEPVVY